MFYSERDLTLGIPVVFVAWSHCWAGSLVDAGKAAVKGMIGRAYISNGQAPKHLQSDLQKWEDRGPYGSCSFLGRCLLLTWTLVVQWQNHKSDEKGFPQSRERYGLARRHAADSEGRARHRTVCQNKTEPLIPPLLDLAGSRLAMDIPMDDEMSIQVSEGAEAEAN